MLASIMFFEGHSPKFGRTRDVGLRLGGPTEDHHHQQRLAPGLPGLAGVPYFEGWRMTCPCRPCRPYLPAPNPLLGRNRGNIVFFL